MASGIRVTVYRRRYWARKANGKRVKRISPFYTIEYAIHGGRPHRIRGYEDKLASEAKAAELKKALARGEQGLVDPYAAHRHRPISEHLTDWLADLGAKGRAAKYISNAK